MCHWIGHEWVSGGRKKIDFKLTHLRLFQPRTFSILLNYFSSTETGSEERKKLKQKSPFGHSLGDCRILVFSSHRIDRKMDIDDIMSSCFVFSRNFLLPSTTIAFLWFILRVMRTFWDVKVKIWQHRKGPSSMSAQINEKIWKIDGKFMHICDISDDFSALRFKFSSDFITQQLTENCYSENPSTPSIYFRVIFPISKLLIFMMTTGIEQVVDGKKPQKLCEIEN